MSIPLIYYIDDNEIDHVIVQRLIHRINPQVVVQCFLSPQHAREALFAPEATSPSVLITDLYFEQGLDVSLLDELQTVGSLPFRIFVLTASIHEEDIQLAQHYPIVSSYLNKPLDRTAIEKILQYVP